MADLRKLAPLIAIAAVALFASPRFATASSGAQATAEAPVYEAAPCCSLCPRAADPAAYVSRFMKDHRTTIQGTEDWLFRTEVDLGTEFPVDEKVLADLARMVRMLNSRGTQVLLLDLPPRGLLTANHLMPESRERYDWKLAMANYRRALQRFRDIGFIVPDYGLLAEQPDGSEYFFRRDGHWTPDGARRTARLIADSVMKQPFYDGLRKKAFTTKQSGQQRHPGVLSIVASQICGGNFPAEVVSGFSTSPSETFPFADEPVPDITLAGTSFSAGPAYHFGGFLQQFLQTDVFNASISGGSFDGALTLYLPSAPFQESPPKLLIWEFAHPQIAAARDTQLRRLIPLIENGCAGKATLLENTVAISSGDGFTEVLFNGGGTIIDARSRDLLVDLQFADAGVNEILGEAWYLDGKHEVVRVRMNDFTRANGRFVLELNREPDYAEQPMIDFRVQIVTPLKEATSVSAALCIRSSPPSAARIHP